MLRPGTCIGRGRESDLDLLIRSWLFILSLLLVEKMSCQMLFDGMYPILIYAMRPEMAEYFSVAKDYKGSSGRITDNLMAGQPIK